MLTYRAMTVDEIPAVLEVRFATVENAITPETNSVEQPIPQADTPSMCGAGATMAMVSMLGLALVRRRLS